MTNTNTENRMDQSVLEDMETDVYMIKKYLNDGETVLDIGANVGYFSLYAIKNFPSCKIIAVEPHPENFKILQNNIKGTKIEPLEMAVDATQGEITLFDFGEESSACHSTFDLGREECNPIKVKSQTIAGIIKSMNIETIHFLKLDCQGSEYSIINSCSKDILNSINYISMEVHEGIANATETLGRIPDFFGKKSSLYKKLIKTHNLVEGNIYQSSIQVWEK